MNDAKSGGPAFPLVYETTQPPADAVPGKLYVSTPATVVCPGLSVRDYFAAHAPIALSDVRLLFGENKVTGQNGEAADPTGRDLIAMLAELRLFYADTLLAAREA